MYIGNWGRNVRELQLRLINVNFPKEGLTDKITDGFYDFPTDSAVNKFAMSRGLDNKYPKNGEKKKDLIWKTLVKQSKIPKYRGKVAPLLASQYSIGKKVGHEGAVIYRTDGSAKYYSFWPGKKPTEKDNLTTKEIPMTFINKGLEKKGGVVDYVNKASREGLDPYDEAIFIYYFSNSQTTKMFNYANVKRAYDLTDYNCGNYVQGILRAGGLYEPEGMLPLEWHTKMDERY